MRRDAVLAVVRAAPPAPPVARVAAEAVRARHAGGGVLGFLLYGSSLRAPGDEALMIDLYAVAARYDRFHAARGLGPVRARLRALLSHALPPDVFTLRFRDPGGTERAVKYAVVTLDALERRCAGGLESTFWARFAQGTAIIDPVDEGVAARLERACADAALTLAAASEGLSGARPTASAFWAAGLAESYRTELRAEAPRARAEAIVAAERARFEALGAAIYGQLDAAGRLAVGAARAPRMAWAARRLVGKPATVLRVLKAAFTFEGGVDYALDKIERHSGVALTLTPSQRRHPLLWSPVLLWRVVRAGAWR